MPCPKKPLPKGSCVFTIDTVHANCGGLTDEELNTVTRALERCYDALGDCRPRLVG